MTTGEPVLGSSTERRRPSESWVKVSWPDAPLEKRARLPGSSQRAGRRATMVYWPICWSPGGSGGVLHVGAGVVAAGGGEAAAFEVEGVSDVGFGDDRTAGDFAALGEAGDDAAEGVEGEGLGASGGIDGGGEERLAGGVALVGIAAVDLVGEDGGRVHPLTVVRTRASKEESGAPGRAASPSAR